MNDLKASWRLRLSTLLILADTAWAFSALKAAPAANAADSVGMANAMVWIFLHLPGAWLGSLPFKNSGVSGGEFPAGQLLLIGALGVLQSAAVGYFAGYLLDKKRKP